MIKRHEKSMNEIYNLDFKASEGLNKTIAEIIEDECNEIAFYSKIHPGNVSWQRLSIGLAIKLSKAQAKL